MELLPNIHLIDGVNSNAYLIIEPAGLTLVDWAFPAATRRFWRTSARWAKRRRN
jgi:hypothetical protein